MIKRLLKLKTMALISGFGITILAERWLNNQNKIMGVFLIIHSPLKLKNTFNLDFLTGSII
ncbi:protein of unknown function [Xenorhabdus bovienii]|uniref:Uncharacterized protein n=1 Tax=Xenorhabdus bovienii TaxID=40576 RepID=A0A0B6XDS2_XENBV|nr:protein of unknown function [Xenorhabdus bovienii]